MITAVGVAVPARNEAGRIRACLDSVQRALARIPPACDAAVFVVAHCCGDGTARIAETALAGRPGAVCEEGDRSMGVGAVRDRANRGVLSLLADHRPEDIWLINTDADTVVPPGWADAHLRHAGEGADAVAGLADLDPRSRLHPRAAARYAELIARHRSATRHDHVYGANLGVRAGAYLQVGGFAPRSTGEDVDLVHRLGRAGFRVVAPTDVWVRTSARTRGRAPGGLADLLARLERAPRRLSSGCPSSCTPSSCSASSCSASSCSASSCQPASSRPAAAPTGPVPLGPVPLPAAGS